MGNTPSAETNVVCLCYKAYARVIVMVSARPRGGQVCKNDRREMKVRKRMFFTTTVVAMVGVLIFGGTALAGKPGTGSVRMATLTGAEVFPAGSGDIDGIGQVKMTLYPNKN